jgi:hypothetical protein
VSAAAQTPATLNSTLTTAFTALEPRLSANAGPPSMSSARHHQHREQHQTPLLPHYTTSQREALIVTDEDKHQTAQDKKLERLGKKLQLLSDKMKTAEKDEGRASAQAQKSDELIQQLFESQKTDRAAIAAFAMMVGIWETGSAQSFVPQHERKYSGNFDPDFPHFELHSYIKAFYSNFNSIQMEFPVMTAYTIDALDKIDQKSKLGLEKEFPEIESVLYSEFRNDSLLPNRKSFKKLPPFEDFLEEIGWDSSHRPW